MRDIADELYKLGVASHISNGVVEVDGYKFQTLKDLMETKNIPYVNAGDTIDGDNRIVIRTLGQTDIVITRQNAIKLEVAINLL